MNVYVWTSGVLKNAYIGEYWWKYSYDFNNAWSISQMQSDWWVFDNASDWEITSDWFHKKSGGDQSLKVNIGNHSTSEKITITCNIYANTWTRNWWMTMLVGWIWCTVRASTYSGSWWFGVETGTNSNYNTSNLSTWSYVLQCVMDLKNKTDTASLTWKQDVSCAIADNDITNMNEYLKIPAWWRWVYIKDISVYVEP